MSDTPDRRTSRFRVRAVPNGSDEQGVTLFSVTGPGINEFATMDRVARLMESALNAADSYARNRPPKPE